MDNVLWALDATEWLLYARWQPNGCYWRCFMISRRTTGTLAVTLGLAGAAWVVAGWRMNGMDMGVATRLDPFLAFFVVWVAMMGAMMLPGATPAALRHVAGTGQLRAL